jgi:surface carbohydrate biosynthesis protein (TIGR04326 family)
LGSSSLGNLIIWDGKGPPPEGKTVLLWNGYKDTYNHHSLLKYIDTNSDRLRAEYLSFIYGFSQFEVSGKRIVEHLEIEKGFSLWWMSLLAEKSPVKSNTVQTTLRLMAIRDLIKVLNPTKIELYSSNPNIAKSINKLCDLHKSPFIFNRQKFSRGSWSIMSIFKRLPHVVQGILVMINHIVKRWSLRCIQRPAWFSGNSSIFIFSYFFNLDKQKSVLGEFYSRQWESFPEFLSKHNIKINWIHHYLSTPNEPNTSIARRWISSFNKNKTDNVHFFLDSFLSVKVIIKSLNQWFKLVVKTIPLEKEMVRLLNNHQHEWLWPIIHKDWKSSVYGVAAMQNILWVNLFEKAMDTIPKQKLGLYLCENLNWERAFIHFWKKHGHGHLIAVPHSTIRYWDLRYFDDRRVWDSKDVLSQPIPDQIAVNGPLSWNTFKKANQPIDRMVKVEALRYLHLDKQKKYKLLKNKTSANEKKKIKLLLLGDIVYETTDAMLKLLEFSHDLLKEKYDLTFKPHPAKPINIQDYPNLILNISNVDLDKLFPKFHGVICSIYTSTSVEAVSIGMPVITILDNNELNYSALYDVHSTSFVSTKSELKEVLVRQYNERSNIINNDINFWTNARLPRWERLIKSQKYL